MKQPDQTDFDQHFASYKQDFTPDVSVGLERVRARVEANGNQAPVRRLTSRRWLSAAAAILLLFTVGYLAFSGDGSTVVFNGTNSPLATALPDGTRVLLQQGAELTYGEAFNDTDRHIELNGQAFFEVHKDAQRPFLVNTSETELRVTGTAFNLRVDGDELEVEVSEGAIQLSREAQVIEVKANQCGLALPGQRVSLMEATNLNRHAWRTGMLRFEATPLAEVIKTIENNYDYEIALANDCDFPVSGTFATDDPVSVLQTLAALGGGELETNPDDKQAFELTGVCE